MKLPLIVLYVFSVVFSPWLVDFNQGLKQAREDNKFILLNFSGSDWCGPCIRMHKDIFDDKDFMSFANDRLVLVNADFPRLKKNQLSKDQQQQNDKLADGYNPEGHFPYTVLLDTTGKVIKAWDGFPEESVPAFVNEIKEVINAR
jgi:thioredoxin-related protein